MSTLTDEAEMATFTKIDVPGLTDSFTMVEPDPEPEGFTLIPIDYSTFVDTDVENIMAHMTWLKHKRTHIGFSNVNYSISRLTAAMDQIKKDNPGFIVTCRSPNVTGDWHVILVVTDNSPPDNEDEAPLENRVE